MIAQNTLAVLAATTLAIAPLAQPQAQKVTPNQPLQLRNFKDLFSKVETYSAVGHFECGTTDYTGTAKYVGDITFKFDGKKGFEYFLSERRVSDSPQPAHRSIRVVCSFPQKHFMRQNKDTPPTPDFGYVATFEFEEDGSPKEKPTELPVDIIPEFDFQAGIRNGPLETVLTWLLSSSLPKQPWYFDESKEGLDIPKGVTLNDFLAGATVTSHNDHPGKLTMTFKGLDRIQEQFELLDNLHIDLVTKVQMGN